MDGAMTRRAAYALLFAIGFIYAGTLLDEMNDRVAPDYWSQQ
jgi:hypothetical protein